MESGAAVRRIIRTGRRIPVYHLGIPVLRGYGSGKRIYVFGASHPIYASLVSLLFGLAEALGIRIELLGLSIPPAIIDMFPYMLAIAALAVSSYVRKRKVQGVVKVKKKKEKLA